MPEHAWWLALGVLVMYAYDAVHLLYDNEVVMHEGANGRWTFSLGADVQFAGRHVFLPPWLAPTRGLLRLRWTWGRLPSARQPLRGLRAWRVAIAACAWPVCLVACLFAMTPAAVYAPLPVLLAWIGSLYLAIAVAVRRLWRVRRVAGLTRREATGITSDALFCPPYALNLIRKQGARAGDRFDLIAVAHALLDAPERKRLAQAIQARVQGRMQLEEVDSDRHAQLEAYAAYIGRALA